MPRSRTGCLMAKKSSLKRATAGRSRSKVTSDIGDELGARLRAFRQTAGITLKQAEEITGVPHATISRIETNKMSPTIPLLAKVVTGLGVPWSEVLPESVRTDPVFGSDVSFSSDMASGIRLGRRDFTFLHSDNPLSTKFQTMIMSTRNRTVTEAGGLGGHPHTELCFVLEGTLRLHLKGRRPRVLETGESALFEATTPHAYTSVGEGETRCLIATLPLPHAGSDEHLPPSLRRFLKS